MGFTSCDRTLRGSAAGNGGQGWKFKPGCPIEKYRKAEILKRKTLDITGKTSPYCLFVVAKEAKALKPSDELLITCDDLPAATTFIPRIAHDASLAVDVRKQDRDHWEIRLKRE